VVRTGHATTCQLGNPVKGFITCIRDTVCVSVLLILCVCLYRFFWGGGSSSGGYRGLLANLTKDLLRRRVLAGFVRLTINAVVCIWTFADVLSVDATSCCGTADDLVSAQSSDGVAKVTFDTPEKGTRALLYVDPDMQISIDHRGFIAVAVRRA
jgi:hypothetical protein